MFLWALVLAALISKYRLLLVAPLMLSLGGMLTKGDFGQNQNGVTKPLWLASPPERQELGKIMRRGEEDDTDKERKRDSKKVKGVEKVEGERRRRRARQRNTKKTTEKENVGGGKREEMRKVGRGWWRSGRKRGEGGGRREGGRKENRMRIRIDKNLSLICLLGQELFVLAGVIYSLRQSSKKLREPFGPEKDYKSCIIFYRNIAKLNIIENRVFGIHVFYFYFVFARALVKPSTYATRMTA